MLKASNTKGFTIIELMISMAVFTTILMLIMLSVTQIGRMYYKGITTARTQEVAREVAENISQQIQFSAAVPESYTLEPVVSGSGQKKVVCMGSYRYISIIDKKVVRGTSDPSTTTGQALWMDEGGSYGEDCKKDAGLVDLVGQNPTIDKNGVGLIPEGMRLLSFDINQANDIWNIVVRVAFGDDDLLDTLQPINVRTCKASQLGSEFCAVSEIQSTVIRRL